LIAVVALRAGAVEERGEGSGEERDNRDRISLERDVQHARRRRCRIRQLRRHGRQLGARPEERIADRMDPGGGRVALEEVDRHARDEVERDRREHERPDARQQMPVCGRHAAVIENVAR
jgi:hypothetical protein